MQQIGQRLKELRLKKGFSQGDIEKKTNLLRCYTSRCENGHTVPSLDTLQKFANALEIPLWQLFHEGNEKVEFIPAEKAKTFQKKDIKFMEQFAAFVPKLDERDRKLILASARQMSHED